MVPKASGAHVRETWSAEVVDLMALARAIVLRQAPLYLIQGNMAELNTAARTLRGEFNYPGVKAVSKKGISSR